MAKNTVINIICVQRYSTKTLMLLGLLQTNVKIFLESYAFIKTRQHCLF